MADYDGGEHAAPPPEEQPKRERSQRRERRKNKWGDGADAADQEKAPEWVQELFDGPSNKLANVMGHIIGPKGVTIAGFRQNSGCHVQVISNPIMPFGKVQIGPASLDKIATCVEMINAKLLDYVARGQAQAQITGMPAQIPPTLVDSEGNYVPIVALEIDAAQQLKELQDLGPTYPGGIVKELTIPGNLMGGIIGPRQTTIAQIRKAAKVRIEIASQPKPGQIGGEGVLRVGPAPPELITKAEELIQYKSEELLGQRPRHPPSFGGAPPFGFGGGPSRPFGSGPGMGGGGGGDPSAPPVIPPGQKCAEVDVPKELMGAMIGAQGTGIERIKATMATHGVTLNISISQNPARDPSVPCAHGVTLNISISQNPARDPSVPCGKLRVGPGEPEKVDIAEQVIRDRVQEVSEMRDASKGKGKDGGKGKGKGFGKDNFGGKGKDKDNYGQSNPYAGYGAGPGPMGGQMGGGHHPQMGGGGYGGQMGGMGGGQMGGGQMGGMGGGQMGQMNQQYGMVGGMNPQGGGQQYGMGGMSGQGQQQMGGMQQQNAGPMAGNTGPMAGNAGPMSGGGQMGGGGMDQMGGMGQMDPAQMAQMLQMQQQMLQQQLAMQGMQQGGMPPPPPPM